VERIESAVKRFSTALVATLLGVALLPASFRSVAPTHAAGSVGPSQATVTVLIGEGQANVSPGSALMFTPKFVDISVGDTVLFKQVDQLEPHTVTFAPAAMLKKMSDNFAIPAPQKNGPPILFFDPQGATPTPGHSYDGMGLANSGFLTFGKSWSLSFTKPGTYKYICLVHGMGMNGTVVVHPAPMGNSWIVTAGDGQASSNDKTNTTTYDGFYPRHLTIHLGDTVTWIGGFHTVTFGPESMLQDLEKHLVVPVPQSGGAPKLALNPKISSQAGGPAYDGTGFVNSGLLLLLAPPTSKNPPMYKLKFTKTGVFDYDCLIHPGMDGTITVIQ
jgi:plastocyanin